MSLVLLALASLLPAAGPDPAPGPHAVQGVDNLAYTIDLQVVIEEFDGESCWFHPRAGIVPSRNGAPPAVVLTMQKWFVNVSDYFSGLSFIRTNDLGAAWSTVATPESLAWRAEDEETTVGVCDFTPGWHPQSGKLLGLGHTVRYRDGKLMPDPRPRETAFSVFDSDTNTWSDWRTVAMPDLPEFFNSGNGCGQWLVDDNGDLLVPIYFKSADAKTYASTVMRCGFEGTTVTYKEHSAPVTHDTPRGVYEPSLTRFQGRYYLTLRNDDRAYVASAGPDLKFGEKQPWLFDDGDEIGSYNTQAHWVTHHDALFLVYTRKGANNDHVIRHRAPLFMSQVDTKTMRLIRATEQIVVPERGAMLGNFGVVTVSPHETWITVGEGMHQSGEPEKHGGKGRVWASKIKWTRPNELRLP